MSSCTKAGELTVALYEEVGTGCDDFDSPLRCASTCDEMITAGQGDQVGYALIKHGWDHLGMFDTMHARYIPMKNYQKFNNLDTTDEYGLTLTLQNCDTAVIDALDHGTLYFGINYLHKSRYGLSL